MKSKWYYPHWIWAHKLHMNEKTGEYEGECVFCFIEGNRRAGKSVGVGLACIDDFIKYGYKCVLLGRTRDFFDKKDKLGMENFWNKCFRHSPHAKEHVLTFEGHHAYIDGILFCYPVHINKFNAAKNRDFDNVRTIIYDEFMAEDGSNLPNEFTSVINIYDTIARSRDDALQTTSVIFISNCVTKVSEFHIELGIDRLLRSDTKRLFRPEEGFCVEVVNNENVVEDVVTSAFGRLCQASNAGQQYLGYAQGNDFKDNDAFVDPNVFCNPTYLYNLYYDGKLYAVMFMQDKGILYFSDSKLNPQWPRTFSITKEDHSIDMQLLNHDLKVKMDTLKTNFGTGRLWFNSMRAKQAFLEIYKYI